MSKKKLSKRLQREVEKNLKARIDAKRIDIENAKEEFEKASDVARACAKVLSRHRKELSTLLLEQLGELDEEKILSLDWTDVTGDLHEAVWKWVSGLKYIVQHGFNTDTKQLLVTTAFIKSKPVKPQVDCVMRFVPFIKATKVGKEMVRLIGVLEETLAQNGAYAIVICDDGTARITKLTYGTTSVVEEFDDAESCLRYVHENLYYEE